MLFTQLFESFDNAGSLNVGDPVIITGNVQFQGKTGDIAGFGRDKRFVIVDLYNHGKHSFHSSDVEYNDYADSDDEEAQMYDRGEFGDEEELNEGIDTDQLAGIIAARLERLEPSVFTDYGIEYVLDAIRDTAEFYAMADFDELGSSDTGAMARDVIRRLKMRDAHMNKGV